MAVDKAQLSIVAAQVGIRAWNLHECNARFENSLDDDTQAAINPGGMAAEEIPKEVIDYLLHLDESLGNAFRYGMLVAVATLHVETLAAYCRFGIIDYDSALKSKKNGSDIAKHLELLRERLNITLSSHLEQCLDDFRILRNFITHDWGNFSLAEAKEALKAEEACNRLNAFHSCAFGRLGDSLVLSDHGAVPFAIDIEHQLNEFLKDEFAKLP